MHTIGVSHYFYNMPLKKRAGTTDKETIRGEKASNCKRTGSLEYLLALAKIWVKVKFVISANTVIVSYFKTILIFISHLKTLFQETCILD